MYKVKSKVTSSFYWKGFVTGITYAKYMTFVRVFYHQYYRKYNQKLILQKVQGHVIDIKGTNVKDLSQRELPNIQSQEEPGSGGGGLLSFTFGVKLNNTRGRCSAEKHELSHTRKHFTASHFCNTNTYSYTYTYIFEGSWRGGGTTHLGFNIKIWLV